ncbi:transposase domain-containing protein, partial [Mesorhizobium sp. M1406]|uniref:transposase domain-containing protein n=1 Tax=Mesorhizobium sp. M1406 TaxID=2957099 RepID=UPI003336FE13
ENDRRNMDASGNETPPSARHGQNDPAMALNRKNALFAGSDGGAGHWAVVASLIETCKLNEVEPLGYLADVLTRIVNGHPNSQIDDLLPWAYIANHELKAIA